jgi:hypothetical protein
MGQLFRNRVCFLGAQVGRIRQEFTWQDANVNLCDSEIIKRTPSEMAGRRQQDTSMRLSENLLTKLRVEVDRAPFGVGETRRVTGVGELYLAPRENGEAGDDEKYGLLLSLKVRGAPHYVYRKLSNA